MTVMLRPQDQSTAELTDDHGFGDERTNDIGDIHPHATELVILEALSTSTLTTGKSCSVYIPRTLVRTRDHTIIL